LRRERVERIIQGFTEGALGATKKCPDGVENKALDRTPTTTLFTFEATGIYNTKLRFSCQRKRLVDFAIKLAKLVPV
jgi:hypothetical protein